LLEAQVRLFSPASAGFRAAGFLGLVRATPLWHAVHMYLARSSAYADLQPGSPVLTNLRERTEGLAGEPEFQALRSRTLWANPENVVLAERYETDFPDEFSHGKDHASVCKPNDRYESPWTFVERGFPK
jgi:hypothetical protein